MTAFHLFLIGDEILTGRRQDQHLPVMLEKLKSRGHHLAEVRILPDDRPTLTSVFKDSLAAHHKVISCGGIGATPDDHTRQALANALGLPLVAHPEALRTMEKLFGADVYPHRIKLTEFPAGAALVPNPVNQVAGCSVREHYLLPGFPEMAWPMADWLLDTHYTNQTPPSTLSIVAPGARESNLIDLMEKLIQRWPNLSFSSLPSFGNSCHAKPHIEFSVTGEEKIAQEAMNFLQQGLDAAQVAWFISKK